MSGIFSKNALRAGLPFTVRAAGTRGLSAALRSPTPANSFQPFSARFSSESNSRKKPIVQILTTTPENAEKIREEYQGLSPEVRAIFNELIPSFQEMETAVSLGCIESLTAASEKMRSEILAKTGLSGEQAEENISTMVRFLKRKIEQENTAQPPTTER